MQRGRRTRHLDDSPRTLACRTRSRLSRSDCADTDAGREGRSPRYARGALPLGSLYHFFPGGKEQLGEEAIAGAGQASLEILEGFFGREPDVAAALDAFLAAITAHSLQASGFADAYPITRAPPSPAASPPSPESRPPRTSRAGAWTSPAASCAIPATASTRSPHQSVTLPATRSAAPSSGHWHSHRGSSAPLPAPGVARPRVRPVLSGWPPDQAGTCAVAWPSDSGCGCGSASTLGPRLNKSDRISRIYLARCSRSEEAPRDRDPGQPLRDPSS